MKKILVFLLVFVLLPLMPAHAGRKVQSSISSVVLYTDQALVQRKASVSVEQGVNEISLPLEAFSIDGESAAAEVFGRGKIISVQVKSIPVASPPQEKIRTLEDKIEKLEQEKAKLIDRKASLSRQEKFLDSVAEFCDSQIPREIETKMLDPKQVGDTFRMLGEKYQEVFTEKTETGRRISDIEEEIKLLRRRLNNLRSSGDERQKVIEVVFDSDRAQEIKIAAEYVVNRASWSPVYRAYVMEDMSGLELAMNARIVQKTGEDWQDVKFSVSNAVPLKGVKLPSLSTWWIDLPSREKAQKAGRISRRLDGAEMAMETAAEKAPARAADRVQTERRETAVAFEYEFPRSVSIESRKKETLLPLYTKSLSGDFYYYCVPAAGSRAYLVCEAEPEQEMLAGPMQVFFEGRYAGKTMFDPEAVKNSFLLALGADRAVHVNRTKVRDHLEETFLGKFERDMVIRELGYRIEIENRKDRKISVHVIDRIPVAKTDKIEVDDVSFEPAPAEKDYQDRSGVMMWSLDIKPESSAVIDISFTVAYPKDQPPLGI